MIIVRMQGGLGNQIFQYALFEKLKKIYPNERVLLDKTSYRVEYPHNGYELEHIFNVRPFYASNKEIRSVTGKIPYVGMGKRLLSKKDFFHKVIKKIFKVINQMVDIVNAWYCRGKSFDTVIYQAYESEYIEDPIIYQLDLNRDWYFNGTWFNCDFSCVKQELQSRFSLKPILLDNLREYVEQMQNTNSVSIHVRRGDYASWNYLILDSQYYIKAIECVCSKIEKPVFFVFSDEIDAVKNEFKTYPNFKNNEFVFVQGNVGENAYWDMIMMSICKHNILANSTFSAAADLLNTNENRITIAPAFWMKEKKTWNNERWLLI